MSEYYRVWYVDSIRGEGQSYDYRYFDDLGEAKKFFETTNDWNDGGIIPRRYIMALDIEKKIAHPGQESFWLKGFNP